METQFSRLSAEYLKENYNANVGGYLVATGDIHCTMSFEKYSKIFILPKGTVLKIDSLVSKDYSIIKSTNRYGQDDYYYMDNLNDNGHYFAIVNIAKLPKKPISNIYKNKMNILLEPDTDDFYHLYKDEYCIFLELEDMKKNLVSVPKSVIDTMNNNLNQYDTETKSKISTYDKSYNHKIKWYCVISLMIIIFCIIGLIIYKINVPDSTLLAGSISFAVICCIIFARLCCLENYRQSIVKHCLFACNEKRWEEFNKFFNVCNELSQHPQPSNKVNLNK